MDKTENENPTADTTIDSEQPTDQETTVDGDKDDNQQDNGSSDDWQVAFPDKTPEDVKNDLQEWKQHSREWEKRAKALKKQVDDTTADGGGDVEKLTAQLNTAQSETSMFRDLIALEIEKGTAVPISELADSIAFRDAYANLDRSDDDFAEKLQSLVERKVKKPQFGASTRGVEVSGTSSAGKDLYQRMFNTDKEK